MQSTRSRNSSRASLRRVLDDLGATLLELAHGDLDSPASAEDIGGVVIHDPADRPVLPRRALILGVGLTTSEAVLDLLPELGEADVAALILRTPVPSTPQVRDAADAVGVALLGLSRGAPWGHLAEMLRSLLTEEAIEGSEPDSLGGLPSGDLFAVANAIASLLDAPVTIEDRSSRVLAFSHGQEDADPSRVQTILGRQVPELYSQILSERGVFRELHRDDKPVYIEPAAGVHHGFTMPRVAISVRAGDEVLGSIWAAVPGPLSEERSIALSESAKLVALHLLKIRASSDARRRARADLVEDALSGGASAGRALEQLGLAAQPIIILGVALDQKRDLTEPTPEAPSVEHQRQRLSDALAVHLAAVHPRAAVAAVGDTTYGLLPAAGVAQEAESRAVRMMNDFFDRVGDRLRPLAAIGPLSGTLAEVTSSRQSVDRVLRVLQERPGGRRVARLDDLQGEALILELRDIATARGDQPLGALAQLFDYDSRHHSQLANTLRAWLDHFGDAVAAAESLFVHQNTFRYRLRRIAQVSGLDLSDPDQRFTIMLQFRVLPTPGTPVLPGSGVSRSVER